MITNTAPFDYRKRRIIIPRLERLCEVCGAHVIPMPPDGAKVCSSCKHPGDCVEVWEHMAHVFRRGLMEKEIEKAYELASQMPDIGGAMELRGIS
jgi:hypothetical protein